MTTMIFGALSVLVALVVAFFGGHAKGKAAADVKAAEQRAQDNNELAAETVKQNQAAIAKQTDAVVQSNEIDENVKRLSDDDLFSELHNGAAVGSTANSDKK